MAITPRRTSAGQTVQGGLESSSKRFRFHSSIAPTFKPETKTSRPFGAKTDTLVSLHKEHGEAAISGDNVVIAELPYYLSSSLGNLTTTDIGGGLFRHSCVFTTNKQDDVQTLTFARGTTARAETIPGGVVSALGLSFSKNGGNSSVSGTILGRAIDTTQTINLSAVRTFAVVGAPTGGTFTLTVNGQTTASLAYNATAAEIQTALVALSTVGAGNATATGGPIDTTSVVVTFAGSLGNVTVTATDTFTETTTSSTGVVTTVEDPDASVLITITEPGGPAPLLAGDALQPGQVAVYLGTSRPTTANPTINASGGNAKNLTVASYDVNISDLFVENHVLDATGPSPKEFLPSAERKSEVKVWVDGDDAGIGLVNSYRTDEKFYVSLVGTLPDGQGVRIHAAVQVANVDDLGDDSGAMGFAVTLQPVDDAVYGGSMVWDVITKQASL